MVRDDSMTAPVLAAGGTPGDARRLQRALHDAGIAEVALADCLSAVQRAGELAPQQIVFFLPEGESGLWTALEQWGGAPPCAICVVAPWIEAAAARALAAAGVVAWTPCLDEPGLASLLAFAQARHVRDAALRNELVRTRTQLEERKWVDRAKGLLMAARGIAEDDAFKLLRDTAMHANLKLAAVSRSVIDAAGRAEAVNRAGQLRMLSQRLVALAAQRVARVDASRARAQHAEARRRVRDNVEHLSSSGLEDDDANALAAVRSAWTAFDEALAARPSTEMIALADVRAEALLQAADHLTRRLEAQGNARAMSIVNLCGSQRMRAQRLAKDALLAGLLPGVQRSDRLQSTLDEFERVLREIEAAPLSSPDIRAALASARDHWLVLLRALRAADLQALVHASDNLLRELDRLTESCERSLQVLLS